MLEYSILSLIGTRIREISVKSTRFNSPSLYKCMQVTPVNTNSRIIRTHFDGPLMFLLTRVYCIVEPR